MQNISDSQIFHHSSHFLYNPTNLLSSSRFPPLKSMVSAFQPSRGAPVRSSRTTMPKLWTSSMPEPPVTMAGWHDVELSKPYWTDLLYIDILNVIYIIIYIYVVCVLYIYIITPQRGENIIFCWLRSARRRLQVFAFFLSGLKAFFFAQWHVRVE